MRDIAAVQIALLLGAYLCSQGSDDLTVSADISNLATTVLGERDNGLPPPSTILAAIEAFGFQRVSYFTGDTYGNLSAGIGMAA